MAVNQQEAEKTERKLRPLYDAVDNGQNKKAIQLADKILKKQEGLHCARALKAIALLRNGRQEEAVSNIGAVLASHPGDQATLQACTMYFKESGEYYKIAEMYADAADHYPKNQEILTHLFMGYVRIGDYQKQQNTAIRLHKAFPESGPYYCWRVMSILMQASDSKNSGKATQLYLPLAEKLIDKYFAENDVDSEAEVRLYLMVLDKLKKTEKKLRILDGVPGAKLKSREECSGQQVDCLVALQQWDRATVMLAEMIWRCPDQWSFIRGYVCCQIKRCQVKRREAQEESRKKEAGGDGRLSEGGEESEGGKAAGSASQESQDAPVTNGCPTSETSNQAVEGEDKWTWKDLNGDEEFLKPLRDARDLLQSLAIEELDVFYSKDRSRYVVRGPLLGRMELVRQLYMNGMHEVPLGIASIEDVLMDYFKLFGTKSCVFDDLCLFLDVYEKIDREAVLGFVRRIREMVESEPIDFDCSDDQLKANIDRLRRHSNLIQLQRFLGCLSMTPKEVLTMCSEFIEGGSKLGRGLGPTVNQPCDFYSILAGHMLLEQYQISYPLPGTVRILWEAIFLLERVKGSNAQISLLLMKLYGLLGANESITELFKEVSIKHLQMETIGYIPMRYIQSMGTFGFANQLYKSTLRFYYGASKEFSEYIIQAYRNGTFTKIEEFVECRDRLTHSFNFVNTLTEMNILEMLLSVNSISQARDFFKKDWIPKLPCSLKEYVSSLVDNRDFTVYDDWSPSSQKLSDVQVKASFDLECLWLRIRLSLVKSLQEAVALTTAGDHVNSEGGGGGAEHHPQGQLEILKQKVEEFRATLEQMEQHVGVLYLRETMKIGSQLTLPLQHPPPCLGFFFLQQGHGQIIFSMLQVIIKLVEGAEPVQDQLKGILKIVETLKSNIQGVPDDLRESLRRLMSLSPLSTPARAPAPPPTATSEAKEEAEGTEEERKEKPEETTQEKGEEPQEGLQEEAGENKAEELDHPYDMLTRIQIDFEPYVLLLQSVSYVLLICMACTELLVPSAPPPGTSKKKKKKMKKAEPATKQTNENQGHLLEFVVELHQVISSVVQLFRPLPLPDNEEEITVKLKNLYLGPAKSGDVPGLLTSPVYQRERDTRSRVCATVLSSYDMSLRDTMQLATSKLEVANALVKRLGGRVDVGGVRGRGGAGESGKETVKQEQATTNPDK